MKRENNREQEFLQDGVAINEYTEMPIYNEQNSIKDVERLRANDNKRAFCAGEILKFSCADNLRIEQPNLRDKNGNIVYTTNEHGEKFPVKDDSKPPFFVFTRYHNSKKASAVLSIANFVDMLESAESKQTDNTKRQIIRDILDTVFPYTTVDFGSFTEQGERAIDTARVSYLLDGRLIYRAFPVLDNSGQPLFCQETYETKQGQIVTITNYIYANSESTGGMFGIK